MGVPWELEWGGIKRSIDAVKERLENPKPVLREFGRKLAKDIRENIKSGGAGWPPLAESTLKRIESTGVGHLGKRGRLRADRIKDTVRALTKLQKKVQDQGWDPKSKAKYKRLEKKIARFRRQEDRAVEVHNWRMNEGLSQKRAAKKLGRSRSTIWRWEKGIHKVFPRLPGTIRNKLGSHVLLTYSRADDVGLAHNEGAGKTPKRQFLPPPNMEENLEYLANLMESTMNEAWEAT